MSSYLKLLFKSSYTNITHVVLGKATSTTRNASLKILKEQWRNIMLDIGLIMCPADGLTSTSSLIETAGISSVHLRVCWEMQQTFCQWHMLSWRSWITCDTDPSQTRGEKKTSVASTCSIVPVAPVLHLLLISLTADQLKLISTHPFS